MTVVPFSPRHRRDVDDAARRLDRARQIHIRRPDDTKAYVRYLELLNDFNAAMLRKAHATIDAMRAGREAAE